MNLQNILYGDLESIFSYLHYNSVELTNDEIKAILTRLIGEVMRNKT